MRFRLAEVLDKRGWTAYRLAKAVEEAGGGPHDPGGLPPCPTRRRGPSGGSRRVERALRGARHNARGPLEYTPGKGTASQGMTGAAIEEVVDVFRAELVRRLGEPWFAEREDLVRGWRR